MDWGAQSLSKRDAMTFKRGIETTDLNPLLLYDLKMQRCFGYCKSGLQVAHTPSDKESLSSFLDRVQEILSHRNNVKQRSFLNFGRNDLNTCIKCISKNASFPKIKTLKITHLKLCLFNHQKLVDPKSQKSIP